MIIDTTQVQKEVDDFCQNFVNKSGIALNKNRLFDDRIAALLSGNNPCLFRRKEKDSYIDYDIVKADKHQDTLVIVFTEDAKSIGDEITVPIELDELAKTGDIADAVFKKLSSIETPEKKKLVSCER